MVRKHKKSLVIMTLNGHGQSFEMFHLEQMSSQQVRSNSQEGFQPWFKSTNHS